MDIGEEYDEKCRAIPYPERPKKPRREDFASNAEHGKALDEWEAALERHRDAARY